MEQAATDGAGDGQSAKQVDQLVAVAARQVDVGDRAQAAIGSGEGPGGALFRNNCIFCHDSGLIKTKTAGWSSERVRSALDKLSALNPAMPDYAGSSTEKDQLAAFILSLNAAGSTVPATADDAGETVFEAHCAMCHGLAEGGNPLLPKVAGWSRQRIRAALDMLEQLQPAMPPMEATSEEKDSLAAFLHQQSQGGQP